MDVPEKKPDENSGILIEGHIRIFDPESGEEFLNQRDLDYGRKDTALD